MWAITWNNGKVVNLTNAAGESFEYVTNYRGDVVRIQDQNGATVATYDYDPWGNLLSAEPTDSRIKGQPILYAGYVYDAETKLYYLQARYYNPATARFISRDPDPGDEDDPVTMNGYTYGDDNPITKTDPDGKWVWLVINAGFAIYDGYKAYKAGKNKKQIAWAVASNFLPIGKVKRLYRATKITKGVGKTVKAGCNCFVAGTKVLTDEGEKNIEDIEVGDMVLAKDEVAGEQAYKEVTLLYRNDKEIIYELTVGDQVIETTDNHPFWVEGKGWVLAADLQVGDKLQQSNGNTLTIDEINIVKHDELVKVYNFTVDEFHTYYVSDLGIWVHNINKFCGSASDLANLARRSKKNDGLQGTKVSANLIYNAAINFVGKGAKVQKINGGMLYTSKDGLRSVRTGRKYGKGVYEANFETFNNKGNRLTNYHVELE
ncbi:polymorphic toxin-type HINT domain-containing protein [Lysinibacillus sp. NPDC093190]|uniref:polymorphic toxin-type HINT domain-containing protein n=1 Tax=Lysinibacillus sp. NPDC093190 TaxID=3390575 RepID=UPI003D073149